MAHQAKRENKELASLVKSHQEALVASLAEDWAACLHVSVQEVTSQVSATLLQLVDALEAGDARRLVYPFSEWAVTQDDDGMEVGELLLLTHSLRRRLWNVVAEAEVSHRPVSQAKNVIAWLRDLMDLVAVTQTAAVDALAATHDTRQREVLNHEQERTARLTEEQSRLVARVRELSSPVIKVWEEVLVLPLVGALDADRAARVMEDLLQGIVTQQAEIVIIDVTGVPVVDTSVANHLMQTAKAAGLLGARSVLVGISAEMAQTMVQLGVDLRGVETRSNLQSGIEFALEALDLRIVPEDEVKLEEVILA